MEIINEEIQDIWNCSCDAICITTNGTVKLNGEAVMGRGNALQAKIKYPQIAKILGNKIKNNGNKVNLLTLQKEDGIYLGNQKVNYHIISFPVKHNWNEIADINLIKESIEFLLSLIKLYSWSKVLLPKPGIGCGRLEWNYVKKSILPLLMKEINLTKNNLYFVSI